MLGHAKVSTEAGLAGSPAWLYVVGVHTSLRVNDVMALVHSLVHIACIIESCVCSPVVAPYPWPWQYVALDQRDQDGRILLSNQSPLKNCPVTRSTAPKTHWAGTGLARLFPGFRLATTDSSMATVWPGPPSCSGLLIKSCEQTSHRKLHQLVTAFSSTPTWTNPYVNLRKPTHW